MGTRHSTDEFDERLDGAVGTTKTANGTPGVWTELIAAAAGRNWLGMQNQDDTGVVYVVAASSQPSNGTADGELKVPTNAFYDFDFSVRQRWFFRSTVASTKVGVWYA